MAGGDIECIFTTDHSYEHDTKPVYHVNEAIIKKLSFVQAPQGIVAIVKKKVNEINYNLNRYLLCDGVADPGNMGTIIRTATATGFHTIVLIDSADAFAPKVIRSSSGGVFYLDIFRMSQEEIASYCKSHNIELLVADMAGENVFKTQFSNENFALVIGNEGQGVSGYFKDNGKIISLPMKPVMESLNAGVSASVLMYALVGKEI
jgi:TrmH family RNA methyltransferase